MKHKGKIPKAVVGELLHVINNALGAIVAHADMVGGEHGKIIEARAMAIAKYVQSLPEKTEWDSCRFDAPASDRKAA